MLSEGEGQNTINIAFREIGTIIARNRRFILKNCIWKCLQVALNTRPVRTPQDRRAPPPDQRLVPPLQRSNNSTLFTHRAINTKIVLLRNERISRSSPSIGSSTMVQFVLQPEHGYIPLLVMIAVFLNFWAL